MNCPNIDCPVMTRELPDLLLGPPPTFLSSRLVLIYMFGQFPSILYIYGPYTGSSQ